MVKQRRKKKLYTWYELIEKTPAGGDVRTMFTRNKNDIKRAVARYNRTYKKPLKYRIKVHKLPFSKIKD